MFGWRRSSPQSEKLCPSEPRRKSKRKKYSYEVINMAPMPSSAGGINLLAKLDTLKVHQCVEALEILADIETENRYKVFNNAGDLCFTVYEEGNFCARMCCLNHRGFKLHVVDSAGNEVMQMKRAFKCCAGLCCCSCLEPCAHRLTVESPVGTAIGSVRQVRYCIAPSFEIRNAQEETLFKIAGPWCVWSGVCCPQDVPFRVNAADGLHPVGDVSRQYAGVTLECFTTANNFRVVFPKDLDVSSKALILSSTFLIDMMFYERGDCCDD